VTLGHCRVSLPLYLCAQPACAIRGAPDMGMVRYAPHNSRTAIAQPPACPDVPPGCRQPGRRCHGRSGRNRGQPGRGTGTLMHQREFCQALRSRGGPAGWPMRGALGEPGCSAAR
jgi:hypothetical protein